MDRGYVDSRFRQNFLGLPCCAAGDDNAKVARSGLFDGLMKFHADPVRLERLPKLLDGPFHRRGRGH